MGRSRLESKWRSTEQRLDRPGFALVVALGLMAFLLLLLLSLVTLIETETRQQQQELSGLEARQNALFGLRVALADLQRHAGPDQRVTARADILTLDRDDLAPGKRYWTGVWRTYDVEIAEDEIVPGTMAPPTWLVSGSDASVSNEDIGPESSWEDSELAPSPELLKRKGPDGDRVLAPLVGLHQNGLELGRFAYWVGDEGIKAKVSLAPESVVGDADGGRYIQATARRFGLELMEGLDSIGSFFEPDGSAGTDATGLRMISNSSQLGLIDDRLSDVATERYFDLTAHGYGLLANTAQGGLRRDLTTRLRSEDELGGYIWHNPKEPNTANDPDVGPFWELLRDYYQLADLTAEFGPDQMPVLNLRRPYRPVASGEFDAQLRHDIGWHNSGRPYRTYAAVQPVMLYSGLTMGLFAARDTEWEEEWESDPDHGSNTTRAYRFNVTMKPIVVLWNPYDVAIRSPNGYVFAIGGGGVPFFVFSNHYTDIKPSNRNVHLAALLPTHPEFAHPYINISDVKDKNGATVHMGRNIPRFSIRPTTLLPGEIAVFTLPQNTSGPFEFIERSDLPDEDLHGAKDDFARGGPYLERGVNFDSYVWVPLHGMPIGSSGSQDNWSGTSADLGHVAYKLDPEEYPPPDGAPESTPLTAYNTPAEQHAPEIWTATRDDDDDLIIKPPVAPDNAGGQIEIGISLTSSGRLSLRLDVGQLFIETDGASGGSDNARIGHRFRMVSRPIAQHERATALASTRFSTAADFEAAFVDPGQQDFLSYGFQLTTPTAVDRDTKLLSTYNLRYPIPSGSGHNNSGNDLGWRTLSPIHENQTFGGFGSLDIAFDEDLLFPSGAVRRVEYSGNFDLEGDTPGERMIGPVLFHIPRGELVSVGQLMHAELAKHVWNSTYTVGNSYASPWIRPNEVDNTEERYLISDQSWHANEALWDNWFFSTLNRNTQLPDNSRLLPLNAEPVAVSNESDAAASLVIDGAFNINSTSVEAWKSLLGSLNRTQLQFSDLSDGPGTGATWESLANPFPRSAWHTLFGAVRTEGDLEYETWRGLPELTAEQISAMAKRIVYELRNRGRPFRSLAQFINREYDRQPAGASTGMRDPRRMGLLQRVLDADYGAEDRLDGEPLADIAINPQGDLSDRIDPAQAGANPMYIEAFQGLKAEGVPGYLMQGDLLQVLGPVLSARSDTFVIRAYGESRRTAGGTAASAVCEGVVQRLPDYVDPSLPPSAQPEENTLNSRFGRRFRLISFRWLNDGE